MKIHLFFGVLTIVLLVVVIGSRRQEAFTFEDVIDLARLLAAGVDRNWESGRIGAGYFSFRRKSQSTVRPS